MEPVTLTGEGVILRPWAEADADDSMLEACNDPLIQQFMPLFPSPYTIDDARFWVNEGAPASWAGGGAAFTVREPGTDRLLGALGIGSVHSQRKQAEIGYWIAPWARGRGVAAAATTAATSFAFSNGFERMELLAAKENPASMRVALKAGYRMEGVRRGGGTVRDGSRKDLVAFVRIVGDPEGPVPRQLPDLPGGVLSDGEVTLRCLAPSDVDDYLALNVLPEVARYHFGEKVTRESAIARCERAEYGWLSGDAAQCAILDAQTGAFAGQIGFVYRQTFMQQGMIGYSLRPEFRGRGFATRAARLLSDWAFDAVGVARVIAGTAPENELSQRVLLRAGFEREAHLKSALRNHDGSRIDDIQFVRISPLLQAS